MLDGALSLVPVAKVGHIGLYRDEDLGGRLDGHRRPMTRTDLLREYQGYKALRAFQTGEIYECNASLTPYFEEVSFRPDYLLREMILLAHPKAALGNLRYFTKMASTPLAQ